MRSSGPLKTTPTQYGNVTQLNAPPCGLSITFRHTPKNIATLAHPGTLLGPPLGQTLTKQTTQFGQSNPTYLLKTTK
jgi:hypothetical protein